MRAEQADGYPRSADESDYDYWQWVTSEEMAEIDLAKDDGASAEILEEIQARLDLHLEKFQLARAQRRL